MMPETYISTDVETDGPIPGPHSLLSLGSAAFTAEGTLLSTFTANLLPLPGASPHPETATFWRAHPDAFAATQQDRQDPATAMHAYSAWVRGLPGRPVLVAYPAGFDFTWVFWYLHRFTGASPFSHSAIDLKTMAMVLLGTDYRASTKRNWPKHWRSTRHMHVALDDAIEQGRAFIAMRAQAQLNATIRTTTRSSGRAPSTPPDGAG
jgi:hypothetical protein